MNIYSYTRYDKDVFFFKKTEALGKARSYSSDCGHVVEVFQHTLVEGPRGDMIVAAANKDFTATKVIIGMRLGRTIKGWAEAAEGPGR